MAEEPLAGGDPKPHGSPPGSAGGQEEDPDPPEQPFRGPPGAALSPPKSPPRDRPEPGQPGGGGGVPKIASWGRPRRPPARTRLRNRRYAALRQLIQAGDYFSEEEMRARDPLLYQHYIGRYQGVTDPSPAGGPQNLPFEPPPKFWGVPPAPQTLSGLLLRSLEEAALQQRLDRQRLQDGDSDEEGDPSSLPDEAELQMLRQEFTTRMHQRFLAGEDPDFDYSQIDEDPELDNLDIVSRDAEERYFDEEEPSAAPQLD